MKLRSLKDGSKTKIKLGACCGHPLTFSAWLIGEEMAFLRRRTPEGQQEESAEQRPANRPSME